MLFCAACRMLYLKRCWKLDWGFTLLKSGSKIVELDWVQLVELRPNIIVMTQTLFYQPHTKIFRNTSKYTTKHSIEKGNSESIMLLFVENTQNYIFSLSSLLCQTKVDAINMEANYFIRKRHLNSFKCLLCKKCCLK